MNSKPKKDMNELAKKVCGSEGLEQNLSIGQVKEVIKIVALILVSDPMFMKAFMGYGLRLVKRQAQGKLWK